MPDSGEIPAFDDRPAPIRLPGSQTFHVPDFSSLHDRPNSCYYHQLANYTFFHKLVRKIRLVVMNRGDVPATDVRLEIPLPNGQGFGIFDWSDVPDVPERRESFLAAEGVKHVSPAQRAGYQDAKTISAL
jgi:hypothetical protein